MKFREFKELTRKLREPRDIKRLSERLGLDEELLLVLYTQKIMQDTTRRFYKVKRKTRKMLHQWMEGESFLQLAKRYEFPPVLIALMIMRENKIPRKRFWKIVRNPQTIKDNRLRREIIEACAYDIVYSPEGMKVQMERGKMGEARLDEWLRQKGIEYRTEKELRGRYSKTPDFLLRSPMKLNGAKRRWIESKATFGSPRELRRHARNQFVPYLSLFGKGMVIYWFGYVEDARVHVPEGICIVDSGFLDKENEA